MPWHVAICTDEKAYEQIKERYIAEWNYYSGSFGALDPKTLHSLCNVSIAFLKLKEYKTALALLRDEVKRIDDADDSEIVSMKCLMTITLYLLRTPVGTCEADLIFQGLKAISNTLPQDGKAYRHFQMLEKVEVTRADFTAFLEWEPSRQTISAVGGCGLLPVKKRGVSNPMSFVEKCLSSPLVRLRSHRHPNLHGGISIGPGRKISGLKGDFNLLPMTSGASSIIKVGDSALGSAVMGSTKSRKQVATRSNPGLSASEAGPTLAIEDHSDVTELKKATEPTARQSNSASDSQYVSPNLLATALLPRVVSTTITPLAMHASTSNDQSVSKLNTTKPESEQGLSTTISGASPRLSTIAWVESQRTPSPLSVKGKESVDDHNEAQGDVKSHSTIQRFSGNRGDFSVYNSMQTDESAVLGGPRTLAVDIRRIKDGYIRSVANVVAELDTSSDADIVADDWLDVVQFDKATHVQPCQDNDKVVGASGEDMQVVGKVKLIITWQIGTKVKHAKRWFYVVCNIPFNDMILGRGFIDNYKILELQSRHVQPIMLSKKKKEEKAQIQKAKTKLVEDQRAEEATQKHELDKLIEHDRLQLHLSQSRSDQANSLGYSSSHSTLPNTAYTNSPTSTRPFSPDNSSLLGGSATSAAQTTSTWGRSRTSSGLTSERLPSRSTSRQDQVPEEALESDEGDQN